jgi:ATP-dependent DNA helicase RecQ
MPELREQLQNLFGLDDFRPRQREVIEEVLRGRDVMCVMPTGAGKSLCYQLPAAMLDGLTVVISPLISLMEDQVQQLTESGIPAVLLNSSLSAPEQRNVIAQLHQGFKGLLYLAPERCFAANFQSTLDQLKPKLLAIDEAHCISQWGHDFRPEYSRLDEVRQRLGEPPTITLTATATHDVREDIVQRMGLIDPTIVITGFDRPNLAYESRRISKVAEKSAEMISLWKEEPGSGIVYCSTRKSVDEVSTLLRERLKGRPVFAYHGGMSGDDRTENQERFMETPAAIAVATNAFGMGINKPDVRLVVHNNVPGTLEGYYQEAGRAGRDGLPARCVMLFSYQDRFTQEFFINRIGKDQPDSDFATIEKLKAHAREKLDVILRYAQTHNCRRRMILDYFGDDAQVHGCNCDVCRRAHGGVVVATGGPVVSDETTTVVRQLLSAIARLNKKFGVGTVADVLAGAETERTQRFSSLSVYGLLKNFGSKRIVAMLHRLMESGLARQRDPEGVKFRPVMELTAAGVAVMKGEVPPPATLADITPSRREAHRAAGGFERREARRPAAAEDDGFQADPEASARFAKLRAVRLELSRSKGLPPYVICHDSVLKSIAMSVPADLEAMKSIKGMGPFKVQTYGQALLDAVRE